MDYVLEENVDLIIMGVKGYFKLELFLLGSVMEDLLVWNKNIFILVVK